MKTTIQKYGFGAITAAIVFSSSVAQATFVSDVTNTSGLKAYWRLGETSGTTAANQVSGSDTGTYTNGVVLNQTGALTASGDNNPSAYFDGTNDWVRMGQTSSGTPLDTTGWGGITMMGWIKPDDLSGSQTIVSRWGGGLSNDQFTLRTNNNKILVAVGNGTNSQNGMTSTGTLTAGVWQFIVGTFDVTSNQYKIYINGSADGASGAQSGTAGIKIITGTSPDVGIGIEHLSSNNPWFQGYIDEVAIFNRALSASEVQNLYNAAITPVPEPGTFAMLLFGSVMLWAVRRKRGR